MGVRRWALGLGLFPCLAFAGDGIFGTKASPVAGPMSADTGGVGLMSFLQMLIALGIVLALLKFVLPRLAGKLNKKIVTKTGSSIHVEESAAFAGGSLYIVRAKSKTLLLCANGQGVSCLADLTESSAQPELPTFQEMVDEELGRSIGVPPMNAVLEVANQSADESAHSIKSALDRLEQLVK